MFEFLKTHSNDTDTQHDKTTTTPLMMEMKVKEFKKSNKFVVNVTALIFIKCNNA
jgi:hypothetical protein